LVKPALAWRDYRAAVSPVGVWQSDNEADDTDAAPDANDPLAVAREGDESPGQTDNSLGRLLALSDGVFAIALTLLALDLHVPALGPHPSNAHLQHALAQQAPRYLSFLISFYVVAGYWRRHRRIMRSVDTTDPTLVGTTLLLLLCVAALPFPAALLGQYGSEAISLVIYGGLNAVAVLVMLRVQYVVRSHRLAPDPPRRDGDRDDTVELVGTLVVFLLCIPAGYVFPGNGAWVLALLIVVQRWQPVWRRIRTHRHGD
jgi:uncharacterized membrane protein